MTTHAEGLNGAVAAELSTARRVADVTYADLATTTGLSKSHLINLLTMKRGFHVKDISLLCAALGVEPGDVMVRAQARLSS